MNELICINYENEKPTVSGRELHTALNIETPYYKWFPRMCEYGFKENKDYEVTDIFVRNRSGGPQSQKDAAITIPMAKELCMLQRSEMGKKFRQHFIAIEEAWNSPEKIMERALQIAHRRAAEAEQRIFRLAEEKETLEIALNESLKYYTVAKYNKAFNLNWSLAECQDIGKRLSAYCRARAIEIKRCETNDERFGMVNSYPLTAWEDFLGVAL